MAEQGRYPAAAGSATFQRLAMRGAMSPNGTGLYFQEVLAATAELLNHYSGTFVLACL